QPHKFNVSYKTMRTTPLALLTLHTLLASQLLFLTACAQIKTAPAQAAPHPIQVYAHRGVRAFAPENTMPAYKTSLRLGTDWLDMDIVLTKDGQVLISHDPLL